MYLKVSSDGLFLTLVRTMLYWVFSFGILRMDLNFSYINGVNCQNPCLSWYHFNVRVFKWMMLIVLEVHSEIILTCALLISWEGNSHCYYSSIINHFGITNETDPIILLKNVSALAISVLNFIFNAMYFIPSFNF